MPIVYKISQWVWLTQDTVNLGFPHSAKIVGISPAETAQYLLSFRDGSLRRVHLAQIAGVK